MGFYDRHSSPFLNFAMSQLKFNFTPLTRSGGFSFGTPVTSFGTPRPLVAEDQGADVGDLDAPPTPGASGSGLPSGFSLLNKKTKEESLLEKVFKENEALQKLKCCVGHCQTFPKPGSKVYVCPKCQLYKCEKCFSGEAPGEAPRAFGQPNILGQPICSSFMCQNTMVLDTVVTGLLSAIVKEQSRKFYYCSNFENGCKEEFLAQKAHEMSCIYQIVCCPSMNCKEIVVFKDVDAHVEQAHNILKVDGEWNFDGTKDELVQVTACLTSYKQKFYPKIYIKDENLYFKVVMLGLQENVLNFNASFTFILANGKRFCVEDFVYPLTEIGKDSKDDFSYVSTSIKKLTEYVDFKTLEFKKQENIQFDLKIINAKLDEIAKDKEHSEEVVDYDG